jgi:aminoglycoside phosphotransferase (APT) family kinase protein
MPEWDAEIDIGGADVRRLLGQFPELERGSIERLDAGWDNTVWVVGGTWAFRFPRRSVAVPLIEHEIAVLPAIAPLMTLPIPVPTFIGRPDDAYPWPFYGAPFLRGRELPSARLPDERRVAAGRAVGAFLKRLHDPALLDEVKIELPHDPNRRADVRVRDVRARERLGQLEELGLWRRTAAVEELLASSVALPAPSTVEETLTHGDLHGRHVLVDDVGSVTAIIDWGDVCIADPGIDLSIAYFAFSDAARDAFFAAYGPVEPARRTRARVLALFRASTLVLYAHDAGLHDLEAESLAALERAID